MLIGPLVTNFSEILIYIKTFCWSSCIWKCHLPKWKPSCPCLNVLNKMLFSHWGPVTHLCITKSIIIGSNNGLSPGQRQAIIWTNDGILLIWPLGINFTEMLIEIHIFSFKKMHLKMSSGYRRPFYAKWMPFCSGFIQGIHVLSHHKPAYTYLRNFILNWMI